MTEERFVRGRDVLFYAKNKRTGKKGWIKGSIFAEMVFEEMTNFALKQTQKGEAKK